ncbi:hypothetical protein LINGRAHAP2_LOCUS2007 [Linum grandiflorum]
MSTALPPRICEFRLHWIPPNLYRGVRRSAIQGNQASCVNSRTRSYLFSALSVIEWAT